MLISILGRYDFEQGVKFQLESDIASMKKVGRKDLVILDKVLEIFQMNIQYIC